MDYEIQVFKAGEADVPGPEVYWQQRFFTWETLYFTIVVIRGGGKTIVINSGPPADLKQLNDFWVASYGEERTAMRRTETETPQAIFERAVLNPEDVDYVLVTPLQAYATANLAMFPNATICISRRGWIEDFHAPTLPMGMPRHLRIPDDVLMYLELHAFDRIRLVEDDEVILPGIRARWAGVHHRSSMAIFVDTNAGVVALSDAAFKFENVEQNIPLGILEGGVGECVTTYAMLREADIVLPLYEREIFERYPNGRITK